MKLRTQTLGLVLLSLPLLWGCDKNPIPKQETKVELTLIGSEAKIRSVDKGEEEFYLSLTSSEQWQAKITPAEASSWLSINRQQGTSASKLRLPVKVLPNTGAQRSAWIVITASGKADSIQITQHTALTTPQPQPDQPSEETPPKPNLLDEHILGDISRLEIPQLAGGSNNYFISHKTADGVVNYSVEYDVQRRHPRWVALIFDSTTASTTYNKRTDAWAWDPQVPSEYDTSHFFSRSGYSRGHMVASSDRYYSTEANKQTFYYTNMSPQLQAHNGGIWKKIEEQVQSWGRNRNFCDVLYVAKGGTIRDGEIESKRLHNLVVIPKYYWMAMIMQKGNTYHAIAFWTEHRGYDRSATPGEMTISIDELEQRTGLDLFHNFPDDIEKRVEAETANSFRWVGLH